jgi:hypothetical protein
MKWTPSNILTTKFYFGAELTNLINEEKVILDQIIHCYITVFNESWGEEWNYDAASKEIISSFSSSKHRIPLAVLLFDRSKVVGFAWAVVTEAEFLSPERDMPFHAKQSEKIDGVNSVKFWLNQASKSRILIFREMGVLKSYRGGNAMTLFFPIIQRANVLGCDYVNYWTSVKSPTLKMGLSFGFWPIKIFSGNGLILLMGNMKCISGLIKDYKGFNFFKKLRLKRLIDVNLSRY